MLVNEQAIGTDQGQKFVLTVDKDNMTQYKAVVLGPLLGQNRVIRSGLAKEDQVIINGLAKVRPGMPVTPTAPTATVPAKDGKKVADAH
jgi:multidrug efflux pump subunit AcrA (membrane-fusion protein)